MDPGTPAFIARYPFQVQEFRPYKSWREVEGHNFPTVSEALIIAKYLKKRGHGYRLRVVDIRSGVVAS